MVKSYNFSWKNNLINFIKSNLFKILNRLKHDLIFILKIKLSRIKIKSFLKRKYILLELGLNERRNSNWITLSLENDSDLTYDLRKGIPFPDNSIDLIYTCHTLEHFSFDEVIFILSECYRTLKKGGELSIAVPNSRKYIDYYSEGRNLSENLQQQFGTRSPIDQINYIAYMGGHHKYMFDEINLIKLISKNPFSSYSLRKFNSQMDHKYHKNTIFASAIK